MIFVIICKNALYHSYADDTVIYCSSPSVVQPLKFLLPSFDVVQSHLTQLKLLLNSDIFIIEMVSTCKYLVLLIRTCHLTHTENLVSKLVKLSKEVGYSIPPCFAYYDWVYTTLLCYSRVAITVRRYADVPIG